jgi:hypothetical protein
VDKLTPRGLDATGLPDGQYRLEVVSGKGYAWVPAVDGVQSVGQGTRINVDNTDPDNPVVSLASELYVLTSTLGTDPVQVWDNDDQLVYTEVSL